jgi:tRNA(adenine34) deaminase
MKENDMVANSEHESFMKRCIELAQSAQLQGNTPVGSLIVIDGEIVGEGVEGLPTGSDVTAHAEVIACQQAVDNLGSKQLDGAILYSTAEPCFMCSYVIRQCGISLVVFGKDTPDIGGVTSNLPILTNAQFGNWLPPPEILGGILQSECEQLSATHKDILAKIDDPLSAGEQIV